MSASPTRPQRAARADAARNRDALLDAARRAFAASGSDGRAVSLEGIAADAGVGIGTLYRHFPSREALAEAVYREEIAALADSAADLLAGLGPVDGLAAWADRFGDYVTTKRGMADALKAAALHEHFPLAEARARLADAVRLFLEAGVADGSLRSDARAEDVVLGLVGIAGATPLPEHREQARRMTGLLLDGLTRRS